MRIVIDMQGAQTESRFRGIGRYTLAFAQAIARNRGDHEIILVLNGLLPEGIATIRDTFSGILPQKNIRVWSSPSLETFGGADWDAWRLVSRASREKFIKSLAPDVVHVTNPFEGFKDASIIDIEGLLDSAHVTVSLYDLIPLTNPDKYLAPNGGFEQFYLGRLEEVKKASAFLAISEFSRSEGVAHLGVSEEDVVNVSTAIDSCFRVLDPSESAHEIQDLLFGLGIKKPFLMYTGGGDERKNLPRLIEAFSALPEEVRGSHQILFAGKLPDYTVSTLEQIGKTHGLESDALCFSGYVSDEDLVYLYNACRAFVFPSWHEGFGLPPVEAMACGAPVIAANTSSLPEVLGLPEALFDPFDLGSIKEKMGAVLGDSEFRTKLREHGLKQAERFSWDETAQRAITVWERLTPKDNRDHQEWGQIQERIRSLQSELIETIAELSLNTDVPESLLRNLATSIAQNETEVLELYRSLPLVGVIRWRLEGPFDSTYSLALLNREMARALKSLGHDIALHSTEGPGDFDPQPNFLSDNPDLAAMYQRAGEMPQDIAQVTSRNLYPPRVADMGCRLNLLHAYGWEESGFPRDWVEMFNATLQGITAMSGHVRKVLIDNGVSVPIRVSGIGVDHWERVVPDPEFNVDSRSFRFLHVSSCFPRKGIDVLIHAFGEAFSDADDVSLVIKTFKNPHNEVHRLVHEAKKGNPSFPDVRILEGDLTDREVKALFEASHVLVAPSRAEGFGLPMAEAMLSNLPVITTGWSGQAEFCTEETAWLLDYRFSRADSHFDIFDSVWAEPDRVHLRETLREVYYLPAEARVAKAVLGRRRLLERYRWEDVAARTVDAARDWSEDNSIAPPKIGWVTTWNTRCGIAKYSEQLVMHFPESVAIMAADEEAPIGLDGENVWRCWSADGLDDLRELAGTLDALELDIVVIQFNYGFFDFHWFSRFLQSEADKGRVVVVMMHSTSDPKAIAGKELTILSDAMRRCARLLVHTPKDLNRLRDLGLTENVALFPHGVIEHGYVPRTPEAQSNETTVASYGFFLPHKGLIELIEAVAILRRQGERVRLQMLNAEYPNADSRLLIERARTLVRDKGLSDTVTITTEFLDESEILDRLAGADMLVFPYQETGESSSAAVRFGIAAQRPTLVTPLAIFDDVAPAVRYLPGGSAREIAEGISLLMGDMKSRSPELTKKQEEASRWRNDHLYPVVAQRLHGLLLGLYRNQR